jgi:serine/threonine-protein kinase
VQPAPVPPLASAPAPAATATVSAAASSNNAADALLLATIVPTAMTPPEQPPAAAATHDAAATTTPPATRTASNGSATTLRESASERRARAVRERQARDADAQFAAAALVAPASGTVKMAISPWGQVEVDGAPSGASPPLTELKLAEGRHQIVVRNGDFAPYTATINVIGGQVISLRYKFGS